MLLAMKERMCCVCRTRKPASDLIRVGKPGQEGRGAHVCPECVEKCIKTRALNRSFKTNVPNDKYEELAKTLVKN